MTTVALFTEFLPASERGEITGGVEAYCHYVGTELQRSYRTVVIAKRTDGRHWETANLRSLAHRALFALRSVLAGVRARPDVVIGTNVLTQPVAWAVGLACRVPVIFWYPDVLVGQWRSGQFGPGGALFELFERAVLKLPADRYIAISQQTAEKLRRQGIAGDRITVIPCGVDATLIEAATDTTPRHAGRLVAVGRLVPYKRVDVIIEALAEVAPRHPELNLVVIGQGPERAALEEQTRLLGVADRVEFRGHVERHADVISTVASSLAFVSATTVEGFGIAVVEAMATGTPYVVSDIDVVREVTNGGTGGLLFQPGSARDMADRLEELLTDPDAREKMSRAGREWAEQYTWRSVADQTAATIAEVLEGRGRRSRRRQRRC